MSVDQVMLNRVRKLLALTNSPNVHEATTAAALAQTLIARHRLETWLAAEQAAGDDPDPIVDARDTPLEVSKRLRTWKVVLACALAGANGCVAYTLDGHAGKAIVLVGRARDRAAVAELWGWLVTRIEWLSATQGVGQSRAWHDAFRVGVVAAIADRLAKVAAEVRGEFTAAALVRVDPAVNAHRIALERFVAEHLQLGRGRGLRVDAAAWQQGRQAGDELDLGPRATAAGAIEVRGRQARRS
jgi:hypothetical protein